jgi:RNA recognition motif-containing protein
MTIYVGNLSFRASEEQLTDLFSQFGEVSSAKIITDKFTGRSKGFAFIEMSDDSAAQRAIDALNEKEFQQRNLKVNQARPKD